HREPGSRRGDGSVRRHASADRDEGQNQADCEPDEVAGVEELGDLDREGLFRFLRRRRIVSPALAGNAPDHPTSTRRRCLKTWPTIRKTACMWLLPPRSMRSPRAIVPTRAESTMSAPTFAAPV